MDLRPTTFDVVVNDPTIAWYSIPVGELPELVAKYVAHIETNTTARAGCKCEWITHPDDVDKAEGERRIRRGEATLNCPVHTKEGFILGFFEYTFNQPPEIKEITGGD